MKLGMTNRLLTPLFLVLGFIGAARADITFRLNPGSTLTPFYPGAPSFNTQPLTGTFVWHELEDQGTLQPFKVSEMSLTSGIYTLKADTTPANDEESDTFTNGVSFFNEILDGTGFPFIDAFWATSETSGTFTGNFQNPTTISYTNVSVQTVGGGGTLYAVLNFSATAIPEPSSFAVAVPMLLILARRPSAARAG
jgi:hypothetical protein